MQRVVLILGCMAIAVALLFPPWQVFQSSGPIHGGYGWLFAMGINSEYVGTSVNTTLLFAQLFGIALIVIFAYQAATRPAVTVVHKRTGSPATSEPNSEQQVMESAPTRAAFARGRSFFSIVYWAVALISLVVLRSILEATLPPEKAMTVVALAVVAAGALFTGIHYKYFAR